MKKSKLISIFMIAILIFTLLTATTVSAYASDEDASADAVESTEAASNDGAGVTSSKAIAAAIVVGIVGVAGAIAMGVSISKSSESMARQPEAASKISSAMMLGLVFIETVIIYALIVAILIIFVL